MDYDIFLLTLSNHALSTCSNSFKINNNVPYLEFVNPYNCLKNKKYTSNTHLVVTS